MNINNILASPSFLSAFQRQKRVLVLLVSLCSSSLYTNSSLASEEDSNVRLTHRQDLVVSFETDASRALAAGETELANRSIRLAQHQGNLASEETALRIIGQDVNNNLSSSTPTNNQLVENSRNSSNVLATNLTSQPFINHQRPAFSTRNIPPLAIFDINNFEEAKRHYTSLNPNPRNQKVAREIIINIADDNTNNDQFDALRILLESSASEDSSFSKNYLFDMILRPDYYNEEKITNAAKVLLECRGNANDSLLASAKRVGARKLITILQYRYDAANILYDSPNNVDKDNALEAYCLIASNEDENIEKRFGAAKKLYPLNSRLSYFNREIPDNHKTAALKVYSNIAEAINQPDQVKIRRLYEVSEFLLGEQRDTHTQIALNAFERIAGMYQDYANESYNSAKKLAHQNFIRYQQVILTSYKNYFDNHNQLITYSEAKESLNLLLKSADHQHRETALKFYWEMLDDIININCQPGKKIHGESGIGEIHEILIKQGHIINIQINIQGTVASERLDIAALSNLKWLMQHLRVVKVPSNQYKFTRQELSKFHQNYARIFNENPKPSDQVFTVLYNNALACYQSLIAER